MKVKNIIIGFGKAGKTLAAFLASKNEEVLLIEKSAKMYGGTCINVGCIPSKTLSHKASYKKHNVDSNQEFYQKSIIEKNELIKKLNFANYNKLASLPNVRIIEGSASFVDENNIIVNGEIFEGERIFINTGATSFIPNIKGMVLGNRILNSETIMELENLPDSLTIIGGGFIGLEFAFTYAKFGSKVTILDANEVFLEKEDDDLREEIKKSLLKYNIEVISNVKIDEVLENENETSIIAKVDSTEITFKQDYILIATGRKPNIEGLKLEKANIKLNSKNAIEVNEFLQTNHSHIFALGDVNGGANFTYISLDDFRIVKSFLFEEQKYSLKDRKYFPTTIFIDPAISKVGLSEKDVKKMNIDYKIFKLPCAMIPKEKILGNDIGFYKVIVDSDNKILGATLFSSESYEVINIITLAINAKLDYQMLQNQLYSHPTMSEALNELFK